jgi:hypothetical protein
MRRLLCLAPWLALLTGTAHAGVFTVPYDFLPKTCPNFFQPPHTLGLPDTVETAVLGTPDFDVRTVRTSSLVLIVPGGGGLLGDTALKPVGYFFKDVARPVEDPTNCKCTAEGSDGTEDLVALFDAEALAKALGDDVHDGDRIPVCMHGTRSDESLFEGCDCIVIELGPLAVEADTWGRVKSTYR